MGDEAETHGLSEDETNDISEASLLFFSKSLGCLISSSTPPPPVPFGWGNWGWNSAFWRLVAFVLESAQPVAGTW